MRFDWWRSIFCDWDANAGRPHVRLLLCLFRLAQLGRTFGGPASVMGTVFAGAYRFVGLFFCSVDIPTRTEIGQGFVIHHGFGLVIHADAVLGDNVTVRQGVTIGARNSQAVPKIGNGVVFGANSMALGDVTIGREARIGAGAVVVKNVAAGDSVKGSSAKSSAPTEEL